MHLSHDSPANAATTSNNLHCRKLPHALLPEQQAGTFFHGRS
jgi:hypothetical protein